jgi:hypothetical protein
MSRSNPQDHLANPAVRWFEWNSETGGVRYYDKDAKTNVDVPLPFAFILLDQLSTVKGWHDASASGIYANEVRDVSQDVLIVKAFKGGVLAEGRYKTIKESIKSQGARFVANCYMAFKDATDGLVIGSLRFKGAALQAWMEFERANRGAVYAQAVTIDGSTEGQKGRVRFKSPTFKLTPVSTETNQIATALDRELQTFLTAYLRKTKQQQADQVGTEPQPEPELVTAGVTSELTDDDIPFIWIAPMVAPLSGLLAGLMSLA